MISLSRAGTIAWGPGIRGLLVFMAVLAVGPTWAADSVSDLRAARRAAHRALQDGPDKAAGPARFGLLVIPVDFTDARLPAAYTPATDLMPALQPAAGATLRSYFLTASGGRMDLDLTVSPVVHLDGNRRDYSDIGYQGFTRSRQLAADAVTAARAMGLDFRTLDNDGPDRRPGTADDDGEVDGVLILHAGIGQENDPENGLIQALQFFLDEPVAANGIRASFYAVASLRSGLGIWAHETGHLLGLEDRYDPLLHPETGGADVRSLGGLGRFSLMASGAWGSGDGREPALLDAYSALSIGWASEVNLAAGVSPLDLAPVLDTGEVIRIWTESARGPEFYLLETRDPDRTPGFDTQVPARQMLLYHVDESVPEGGWRQDDGPRGYHLRVRLVEADNDFALAEGRDDGSPSDLYPGSLGKTRFGVDTLPSNWGYEGPSHVTLDAIAVTDTGVALTAGAAAWPSVTFDAVFGPGPDAVLDLAVTETGTALAALNGEITAVGGHVDGSWDGEPVAVFTLARDAAGVWRPAEPPVWRQNSDPGIAGGTFFRYRFTGPGFDSDDQDRLWAWSTPDQVFDITSPLWGVQWPGEDRNTGWYVWDSAPWLTADGSPVLACTGSDFTDSGAWPAVTYQNRAWVRRRSPALGPDVTAVRLLHAVESEILHTGTAMDGARVVWRNPDGVRVGVPPVDGWDLDISPRTLNALAGDGVLADSLLSLEAGQPVWRTDVFPVPDGPGPWSLELTFASNTLWRYRGWFIAEMTPLAGTVPASAFPAAWTADGGLTWTWPFADPAPSTFTVQGYDDVRGAWTDLLETGTNRVGTGQLTAVLGGGPSTRHRVRVVGDHAKGPVATRSVTVYGDGGLAPGVVLGVPRPNPSTGAVRFTLDVPDGSAVQVGVYDVRGRRVTSFAYPAGRHLVHWTGRDGDGRPMAAGTYYIRLEGSGRSTTRKVVLLK